MMSQTFFRSIILGCAIALAFFLPSCTNNPHDVDISNIEIDIDLKRYEDDIFGVKTFEEFQALDSMDPEFFKAYKEGIIGTPTGMNIARTPEQKFEAFFEFVSHKDMRDLYETCMEKYPDFSGHFEAFKTAFRYFNYHFPDKNIPDIITFVSPFQYASIAMEDRLCIGLDMYLGPGFEPYRTPSLQFTEYMIAKFKEDMIVPNGMKAWLISEFPETESGRFLDKIIYEGKLLYAMDAMFPHMADSLKIGYTAGKIEWNKANEPQIWQNIIDNDLLFSTEEMDYMGMIHDGPFSKGVNVPQESSPMLGIWVGWQIVRKYMKKHPKTSLKELMEMEDSDKIMKASAYKP